MFINIGADMLNLVGATATTFLALVVNSMAADVELSCITPGPDPGGFVVSDLTGTEKVCVIGSFNVTLIKSLFAMHRPTFIATMITTQ